MNKPIPMCSMYIVLVRIISTNASIACMPYACKLKDPCGPCNYNEKSLSFLNVRTRQNFFRYPSKKKEYAQGVGILS